MAIEIDDLVPLSSAKPNFDKLAREARQGKEKIVTRNGRAYVAIVDARRLAEYHQLARENGTLLWLREAEQGLREAADGKGKSLSAMKKKWLAANE